MSYASELGQLARALVDVALTAQRDLAEFPVALVARRSVLELLTAVHQDVTGVQVVPGVTQLGDVERHPVAALGEALARHPRPTLPFSPTDAMIVEVTSEAGAAWRRVARHALLAQHHWLAGDGPEPDPTTRWTGVADLAAISRQLAVLDVQLAERLDDAGPRWQRTARLLGFAATSGLGTAGREVARLAAAGPVAEAGPDRSAASGPGRRVLVARSGADLPHTLRRLVEFLDGAHLVLPQRLPHLATGIARCALLARDQFPADDPTARPLRAELREHARLLHQATARPGGITCLEPGDGRPLRQAAEAYQGLARHAGALRGDPALLADYVDALAASTQALAGVVDRSIGRGCWLVPDRGTSLVESAWTPLRRGSQPPGPVLAVRAASRHAPVLRDAATAWRRPSASEQVRAVVTLAAGASPGVLPGSRSALAAVAPGLGADPATRRPALPSHRAVARIRS